MIEPLRKRASFERLSRKGRRYQGTIAWMRFAPGDPGAEARLAFAIGKSVGNAVVRNRVRRRLRSVLTAIDGDGDLPPGFYLFGARSGEAAEVNFQLLDADVRKLVDRIRSDAMQNR